MKLIDIVEKLHIKKKVTMLQLKSIFNVVKNEDKIDIVSLIENLFNSFPIDTVQSVDSYELYSNKDLYENTIANSKIENGNCIYEDNSFNRTITLVIAAATNNRKLLILEN